MGIADERGRTPLPERHPGATPSLVIDDRAGSIWRVGAGQVFTVGREGDLAFPDNPYLHGRIVAVAFHAGLWWISNVGRHLPVKVIDERTGAQTVLRSGTSDVIVSDVLVVFEAGPTTYEVAIVVMTPIRPPEIVRVGASSSDRLTVGHGELTLDQYRLLTAMAEPLLRHPGTGLDRIPGITVVAHRLGWSVTKTNRQLDRLCERLADRGVWGLVNDGHGSSVNRRTRLVEYALDARLVTPEDLVILDRH